VPAGIGAFAVSEVFQNLLIISAYLLK